MNSENKSVQFHHLCEGSMIGSEAIMIQKAEGAYLWDAQGKRYLDLFSQTWSMPLGHSNEKIIKAVGEQLTRITHLRTAYSTEEKSKLAREIIKLSPVGLNKVNFVLHGSLAVEGAMKLAVNKYENRSKILYLEDGFHGRSLATMGISWKMPGSKYSNYFTNGVEVKKDLGDIEKKIKCENPAAIIIELVQGNAGCKILDKEFVKGVRALCNKYDVVMVVDEVQTAFGCMGKMFLCEDYEVVPDILVFGKAIGGGFPLAGTIYKDEFSFQPGEHSFTFGHSPVSMAAGLAYLEELKPLLKNVNSLSQQIKNPLLGLESKYKNLRGARCIGVKGAIDIVDEFGNPDPKTADLIVLKMLEKGIIIANSKCRHLGNTLMLQLPLIITPAQLQYAFEVLDGILNEIYKISERDKYE
ncbi:aspartate aminotransferase family protein [Candidatus Woesearchaeota archaeon]|nr:aspartate aminotransferase family protein [Candidatus Woesearchaeota archaeon]